MPTHPLSPTVCRFLSLCSVFSPLFPCSTSKSISSVWAEYNRIKDAWEYPHVQQGGMKGDHVEHVDLVLRVIGQYPHLLQRATVFNIVWDCLISSLGPLPSYCPQTEKVSHWPASHSSHSSCKLNRVCLTLFAVFSAQTKDGFSSWNA